MLFWNFYFRFVIEARNTWSTLFFIFQNLFSNETVYIYLKSQYTWRNVKATVFKIAVDFYTYLWVSSRYIISNVDKDFQSSRTIFFQTCGNKSDISVRLSQMCWMSYFNDDISRNFTFGYENITNRVQQLLHKLFSLVHFLNVLVYVSQMININAKRIFLSHIEYFFFL